jgi:hypothetical protein
MTCAAEVYDMCSSANEGLRQLEAVRFACVDGSPKRVGFKKGDWVLCSVDRYINKDTTVVDLEWARIGEFFLVPPPPPSPSPSPSTRLQSLSHTLMNMLVREHACPVQAKHTVVDTEFHGSPPPPQIN